MGKHEVMASATPQIKMRWLRRLGHRFSAWALGFGLVGVHVAIFLLTATVLILVDLYRSPGALTVDDGLQTWGSIVALHALAVTVFQVVRWAINEEQIEAVGEPDTSTVGVSTVGPPPSLPAPGAVVRAWWSNVTTQWRTALSAADPAAPDTTITTSPPAVNGHTPNGHHPWPQRETTTVQPAAWPAPPHEPAGQPHNTAPDHERASHDHDLERVRLDPARWSWVEAAAADWLMPRSLDKSAESETETETETGTAPTASPASAEPEPPSSSA